MVDDLTYLRLFVSPYEPWDEYLKKLHSKRLPKNEIKNRIGFAVINGAQGKVMQNKAPMWLMGCESFVQYAHQDWGQMYEDIKQSDAETIKLRKKLLGIEYLTPEQILNDSSLLWLFSYMLEEWAMERQETAEEISVYGAGIISEFVKFTPRVYRPNKGRYHFVRALNAYIKNNVKDVIKMKTYESRHIMGTKNNA